MKHTLLSRLAIVGAFLAALACVALAPSEAHAQRFRPGYGPVVVVPRGGYNRGGFRREVIRQEMQRRQAARFDRRAGWGAPRYNPAPRWQAPRWQGPRYDRRGRW